MSWGEGFAPHFNGLLPSCPSRSGFQREPGLWLGQLTPVKIPTPSLPAKFLFQGLFFIIYLFLLPSFLSFILSFWSSFFLCNFSFFPFFCSLFFFPFPDLFSFFLNVSSSFPLFFLFLYNLFFGLFFPSQCFPSP